MEEKPGCYRYVDRCMRRDLYQLGLYRRSGSYGADRYAGSTDLLVLGTDDPVQQGNTTVNDYFAAVRLSRQEARDSAITLLQEAMVYDEGTEVSTSQTQLELLVQSALTESQIESLVIAKGYADCVAYISDEKISIAVASPEGGIQDKDVALIADIVMSQSDFDLEDIYVVEVQ